MKKLVLVFALALTISAIGQDRKIEFRDVTFDEALAAAKKEKKPIFMDCYTVWCGPCKWMSANIFTNNDVADYFNENFVCVKFDMEKGEGTSIAREFKIRAYPTLIYVNAERELVMKAVGASRDPQSYIKTGGYAKSKDYNLIALSENVSKNRNNAEFMQIYFDVMAGAGMADAEEVNKYFEGISKEEWSSQANWKIITGVVDDIESPVFQDLLNNTEAYKANNGDNVDMFVAYKIRNALMSQLYSRKEDATEKYAALYAKVETWEFEGKDGILFSTESARLARIDQTQYFDYCVANVEKAIWDNANELNSVAWNFFEKAKDPKYTKAAEEWAARACELTEYKSHAILDTYANLLHVNGDSKKALEMETKALELAKADGADTKSYEKVIENIRTAL
jgi:thioredoxin-related protein